jgi:hypothetical protein
VDSAAILAAWKGTQVRRRPKPETTAEEQTITRPAFYRTDGNGPYRMNREGGANVALNRGLDITLSPGRAAATQVLTGTTSEASFPPGGTTTSTS